MHSALTSSLSSTSTLPLASSSICLWMLRTASKLSCSSSLWHKGRSMRQNSVGGKGEGYKHPKHVPEVLNT